MDSRGNISPDNRSEGRDARETRTTPIPTTCPSRSVPSGVTWRQDATTHRWLRLPLLLGRGLLYGVQALVLGAVLTMLGLVLWTGSTGARLLVVLLGLVGGPLSVLYLLPMLRDPDQRPTFYPDAMAAGPTLPIHRRVLLGLVGAALLAGAWLVDPRLSALLAAVGLLGGAGYALSTTRGSVDPETATLRVAAREYDLAPVTDYRIRRLGPVVLFTLSATNRPGRFGTVPSRFRVPADRLDAVRAALDAIVADEPPAGGREPNTQVRLVAGGLALLFGGVAAVVVGTVGGVVGWYVAAICGLFAVILLLVAREG